MKDWNTVDQNAECDDYTMIEKVANHLRGTDHSDFSEDNRFVLNRFIYHHQPKCIVEIGVENNPDVSKTSTSVFLSNKEDIALYIGVDILSRSHLDNPDKNIHTIQTGSENVDRVMEFVRSKGHSQIDMLFLDGWHSVAQCKIEWDSYTPFLSPKGVVGWHDTNWHYGPQFLLDYIDRQAWYVDNYPFNNQQDFGIAFAWRK